MAKQKRPAPSVTQGQGGSDLASTSRTSDEEIDALLDEAGVGDEPETPAAPATDPAADPAARPGAPTPENPVVGGETPPTDPATPPAKDPKAPLAAVTAPAKPAAPAPAVGADGKPVAGIPATPPAPAKAPDAEVDKLSLPESSSPGAKENFQKLREIASARKDEIATVRAQYKEAVDEIVKLQKARGQLPEPVTKELAELKSFRRLFDIRNDAEFKTKFDEKVEANDKDIAEMLKTGGLPEDAIKKIQTAGFQNHPMSWWQEQVFKPLMDSDNPADNKLAVAIKAKLEQNMLLSTEKDAAIANASKEGSEWQKQREAEVTKKKDEETTVMRSTLEELQKSVPWGVKQEIPADAAPEVRAKIERENQMYEKAEKLLPMLLNPENPRQRMEQAALAILSFWQRDEIERVSQEGIQLATAMQTKLDALEAENAKLKSAGKTNKAGGAAPVTPTKTGNSIENIGMKNEEAVEKLMQEQGL